MSQLCTLSLNLHSRFCCSLQLIVPWWLQLCGGGAGNTNARQALYHWATPHPLSDLLPNYFPCKSQMCWSFHVFPQAIFHFLPDTWMIPHPNLPHHLSCTVRRSWFCAYFWSYIWRRLICVVVISELTWLSSSRRCLPISFLTPRLQFFYLVANTDTLFFCQLLHLVMESYCRCFRKDIFI